MIRTEKALSLALAKAICEAAESRARELGLRLVISVIDNHGLLQCFHRMDGSSAGSVSISQQKAYTSAVLPVSTRALAERSANMPGGPYGGGALPGVVLLPGGLPIVSQDGAHLGGIGISGATPDLDEDCARAGLAVAAPYL